MLVDRPGYRQQIAESLARFPVTALLGPRQCGKTTLARTFASGPESYFDLEDPVDLARLEAPRHALGKRRGLVVIDEFPRRPDLLPILRVLADRPERPTSFLVLGSASPDLVRGVSESLAGRVGFVDLGGFDGTEVGFDRWDTLWLRGGFPESFLSESDDASFQWRQQFIRTFLTRDIPQLGISIPAEQLRRFWFMIAHSHGQTWNASEIAGSLGINYKTAQRYLDILTGAFLIRSLPAWTENLGKRVRRASKVYRRDSGRFHALHNIRHRHELEVHPKLGASWEGLAVEHLLRVLRSEPGEAFYWSTHGGAELDLMLVRGGGGGGSNSSTPMLPAPRRPCAWPWRIWDFSACSSSTRVKGNTRWTTPSKSSPPPPWPTAGAPPESESAGSALAESGPALRVPVDLMEERLPRRIEAEPRGQSGPRARRAGDRHGDKGTRTRP